MKKTVAEFILKCMGWKVGEFTPSEQKYVLIIAPHTSNWDFVIGRLAFWTKGLPARFMIKKEFFIFPIGFLLKALGGLPVDRAVATATLGQSIKIMRNCERMAMIITPEGTRQYNPRWKKGFYQIACTAQVPLYVGYMDYKKKECCIVKSIPLTGEWAADWPKIREVFQGVTARYPKKFCLPPA